jgi:hypothetical protein
MSGWRAQRALVHITDGIDRQYRQYGNDELINAALTCHHYVMLYLLHDVILDGTNRQYRQSCAGYKHH